MTAEQETQSAALMRLAQAGDQMAYNQAISTFNYVNGLIGYRIDLIGDIRMFRKILLLP